MTHWILQLKAILILTVFTFSTLTYAFASNKALVIIDMQDSFVTYDGNEDLGDNPQKTEEIIRRHIQLIDTAKQNNIPILVVEYQNEGPTNNSLLSAIGDYEYFKLMEKSDDGLFSKENFSRNQAIVLLEKWDISDLIITGANGNHCVRESIRGALSQGYRVWAYNRGIADFNSASFIFPYYYKNIQKIPDSFKSNFTQSEEPHDIYHLLGEPLLAVGP